MRLPDDATVADACDQLAAAHPQLAPALSSALPVIDGTHADRQQLLHSGDVVALLAPVSGG